MSTVSRTSPLGRRAALTAGIACAAGALVLGVVSSATAAQPDAQPGGDPRAARSTVTVTVTQRSDYVGALCATDILAGRCEFGVPRGGSRTFTVNPPAGTPISVRAVPRGGGFAEMSVVPTGTALCFTTAGTRPAPTVTQMPCP